MVCITGGILVAVLFLLFGLVSVRDIVPQWAKKGKLNKESLLMRSRERTFEWLIIYYNLEN